MRYLLIFAGIVLLAVAAAALYAGLGFYLGEELTPTTIELKPAR